VHNIVPEFIIENFKAARYRGSFRAASMFLDISGFSAMTDELMQHGQHGAEVLTGLMRAVFDPIVNAIFGQGGMIVGYAGDAITALYFVDIDDLSTARRALASATAIQGGLQAKSSHETPYGVFNVSAKIGIALGQVSWGILRSRSGEKATYYFRGDAVNEAVQAECQANTGDIVLDKKIYAELSHEVVADRLSSFYLLQDVSGELPLSQSVTPLSIDSTIASVFAPADVINENLRGEFRQAVNLFMRIPELANEQLENFMHNFFDLQAKYGGLIDRIDFGDKGCNMIVLWGAPVAYENDIGRALNFIFDLKTQVDFPVTAGLTYYISHAGYIGGQLFENYTCYGWGINLAARFMMNAPDGEVWLDERIAQRSKKRFNLEYVGKQNFKGFAQKQSVYVLRDRKSESEAFFQGEMLGRDAELQRLAEFVDPIWSGNFAGVMNTWGEAGMGKSRLVYEFRHSALFKERIALWAVCQSDQILRHSFNPLRYWLFRYFDILTGKDNRGRLRKFQKKLGDLISSTEDQELAAELQRTRSFLAALVDLNWPDSLYNQLDAQGRYDNTIIALISFLKAESLRQPLLLFIEDAQYLDEDSKSFLPRLKRALTAENSSYPIAILLTTRWQNTKILLEENFVDHDIDLNALPHAAISQMAAEILGQSADPALVKLIDERAEGNPFFAEQILRYLQAEENLELRESGWAIRKNWKSSVLPADISTMLVARLDQLTHQVKEVVHTASALGREFDLQILSRMLVNDSFLEDEIAEAENASVWFPLSEIRYIFKHSLMRDVAYNMQLEARRQELHAIALDAIEELFADNLHQHYTELAYHSEQALLEEKARDYLRKAGDTARDSYRNLEAIDYYSRAIAHILPDNLFEKFDVLLERAAIYDRRGDRSSQIKDLDELEKLALKFENDKYKALIWSTKAEYFYSISDFANSIECAKHALGFPNDNIDDDVLLGAYVTTANSLLRLGKLDDATIGAKEGLAIARSSKAKLEEGRILNTMSLIAIEQNETEIAQECLIETVNIARELGNLVLEGKALNNLAHLAGTIQGDCSQARKYLELAYDIFHERGDRYGQGLLLTNLGWCAGMQGDYKAAQKHLEQSLVIAREVGNAYQEAYTLINLSSITGIQGEASAAINYANQAYEMSLKIGERSGEAWSYLNLGHAFLLTGEFEKAQSAYKNSIAIRNELEQLGLAMEPTAGLIQVALSTNNLRTAIQYTEFVLDYLETGGTFEGAEEPLRIYLACFNALEKIKDPRSHNVLQRAIHLLDAQVSMLSDEGSRHMYVQNVPWRQAIKDAWETSQGNDYPNPTAGSPGDV